MSQKLKYISRIKDEFDTIICGVNGVFAYGDNILAPAVDALIKLYQSGKKITLASNSGMRVRDLYYALKQNFLSETVLIYVLFLTVYQVELQHLKPQTCLSYKNELKTASQYQVYQKILY
jgi:hypothetical protein